MTWATFRSGDDLYRLTDGYVEVVKTAKRERSHAYDFEQQMATNVLRLADQLYRRKARLDPMDVLILGKAGWDPTMANEPARSIIGDERDENYRMVITRETTYSDIEAPVPQWSKWITSSGLRRKKKHGSKTTFQQNGETLLALLHDHVQNSKSSYAQLFNTLNTPFAYAGRSGANRDGTASSRIQQ